MVGFRAVIGVLFAGFAATAATSDVRSLSSTASTSTADRCFPKDFLFGSATASYQVEGAWNETGRTPSIWDDFCRAQPGLACANVADDFLHRYRDDIQLMKDTNLDSFRFSISWSRVMNWDSKTQRMKKNKPGIAFYHALIDELLRQEIVPILTLYHWDLPSELHTELSPQGWINRQIIDHFVQYAELMFTEFGSKVDMWTTFNEPHSFVEFGYGSGVHAPGYTGYEYVVGHHVLLSHAAAVQRFRALKKQGDIGKTARISIVLSADHTYPLDPSNPLDVAAADRKSDFILGWFLLPIVTGHYPVTMRERAGNRLPEFTTDEAALLKGSYDLFMLNYYSSRAGTDCSTEQSTVRCGEGNSQWAKDLGVDDNRLPDGSVLPTFGPDAGISYCKLFTPHPVGYLDTIKWMHAKDPKAEILLTENGHCGDETIEDAGQLSYFQTHVEQVHKAIYEFQIPVIGYTAWSFMDNYEWGSFSHQFGLYYVNFTSQTGSKEGYTPKSTDLARIPRTAAKWYSQVAKTKCLDNTSVTTSGVAAVTLGAVAESYAATSSSSSFQFGLPVIGACLVAAAVVVAIWRKTKQHGRRHAGASSEGSSLLSSN
ncbi:Beta-glucosidase 32, partial [Globisporangium splendens]